MTQQTHRSVIATAGPVPIDRLRPHPGNPNTGDVEAIADSLTTTGQYRQVVARTDGTILAGHHVYEAAMSLGWTELEVTFVDVDDQTAKRIMVADNRLADLGMGVDLGLLMPLLKELEADLGLDGTGYTPFDMEKLEQALAVPLEFPEYDHTLDGGSDSQPDPEAPAGRAHADREPEPPAVVICPACSHEFEPQP